MTLFRRRVWSAAGWVLPWVLLLGLVAFEGVHIMTDPYWAPGDDYIFTRSTASGDWVGFHEQVRPGDCRFFPLAFQEFNLLIGAGNAPHLYYVIQLTKHLVTVLALVLTMRAVLRSHLAGRTPDLRDPTKPSARTLAGFGAAILVVVFLLQPRNHLVWGCIIYPESMQMVWLALFVLFGYRGARSGGVVNYAAAVLFGSLSLYYKEPAFAMLLPVALLPLAVRFRSLTRAQRVYSVSLLLSVLLWAGLFYHLVYSRHTGANYASRYANTTNVLEALGRLVLDPTTVYLPMTVLAAYRAVAIGRTMWKGRSYSMGMEQLFVDSLLFGGVLYIVAFAFLGLVDLRFLPPVNVFFVVVCFYYGFKLIDRAWRGGVPGGRRAVAILAVVVLLWLPARLTVQWVGFQWVHNYRTWAPTLGIMARHSRCPVIFVYPDSSKLPGDPRGAKKPLTMFFVKATRTILRLEAPPGVRPPKMAYLDVDGDLSEMETLPGSRVSVIRKLPATGKYFLLVPRDVKDFEHTMADRYGTEVVRYSKFDFHDPFVRAVWVPRSFARQLPEAPGP